MGAQLGALHRLVDQSLCDHRQFHILGLTGPPQAIERLLRTAAMPATQNADRLIDHRPTHQGTLQLIDFVPGSSQELRVVHRHSGRYREQFTQTHRVLTENIAPVRKAIDRTDHLIFNQQRQ